MYHDAIAKQAKTSTSLSRLAELANANAPVAVDKPETAVALDRLYRSVEDANMQLGALIDRLCPVLLPSPPEKAGTDAAGSGYGSQIAAQIAGAADGVESLRRRINDALDRLAV
jgi:hypothetical protein